MRYKIAILITFLFLTDLYSQNTNDLESVSIIHLISNPEEYHQKKIRVVGFMNLEFEGNSIYLGKEDSELRITKNGLWLSLTRDKRNELKADGLHQKYVSLIGIFNMIEKGHKGLWSGSITDVERVWERKKD